MRTRESQSIFSESASGDRVHSPCHAIHAVLQCKRTLCASATVRTNHLVVVFSLKRFLMKSMWCAFQFYLSVFFSFLSFSMMIIIMKMLKEELYARAHYHWFGSSSYIHIYISLSLFDGLKIVVFHSLHLLRVVVFVMLWLCGTL